MTSQTPDQLSPVIFDNTVLSNFALEQNFDVIEKLYKNRAFICSNLLAEIKLRNRNGWKYHQYGRNRLQAVHHALNNGWIRLPDMETDPSDKVLELKLAQEYGQEFSICESESMAIAYCRKWVFASDCHMVRNFARTRGIKVTGSIGILVRAVNEKMINLDVADSFHSRMIEEGYRSPLEYKQGISSFVKCNS